MKPVAIEVITYAPTLFTHCQHCELAFGQVGLGERVRRDMAAASLPDDLTRDFQALSDWIHGLFDRFGPRLRVRVVDAASIEGFAKSLRHRVSRYPVVIVDGHATQDGGDLRALEPLIQARLAAAATVETGGGAG
jgi:hypothetical protein